MDPPASKMRHCEVPDQTINPGARSRRLMRQISGITMDPAVRRDAGSDDSSDWENDSYVSVTSDPTAYTGAGLANTKSLLQQASRTKQNGQSNTPNATKAKKKTLGIALKSYFLGTGGKSVTSKNRSTRTKSTRTRRNNEEESLTDFDVTGSSDNMHIEVRESSFRVCQIFDANHDIGCVTVGCRPRAAAIDDFFPQQNSPHSSLNTITRRQPPVSAQIPPQARKSPNPPKPALKTSRPKTNDGRQLHEFLKNVSPDAVDLLKGQRPDRRPSLHSKKSITKEEELKSGDGAKRSPKESAVDPVEYVSPVIRRKPKSNLKKKSTPELPVPVEFTPGLRQFSDDSSSASLLRKIDAKNVTSQVCSDKAKKGEIYKTRAIPTNPDTVFQEERAVRRSSVSNMYMVKSDIVLDTLEEAKAYKPKKPKYKSQFPAGRCEV